MLAADALTLGAVYVDLDNGSDVTHDLIEITYEGGSSDTTLQQITINAKPGVYFDTVADGPADAGAMIPKLDTSSSVGISASDVSVALSNPLRDGFQTITLTVDNFAAGDVLSLQVDADEVEGLNGDPIVSGAEFELTRIDAVFVDPLLDYKPVDPQLTETDVANLTDNDFTNDPAINGTEYGVFWDHYDPNFAAAGIDGLLPPDANAPDRSDGLVQVYRPDPVEIHGSVHLSTSDEDCFDPTSEHVESLEGAVVYLVNDQGQWMRSESDANGEFWFTSADLPEGELLLPGTYTLIEVTPEGLIDGDGHVGSITGTSTDEGILTDNLTEITLQDGGTLLISDIVDPSELGRLDFITDITLVSGDVGEDYIFCEHPPAELSGYVYHDENLNEQFDPATEHGIAGVEVGLFDEFGNQVGDSAYTDANGFYKFTGLAAGQYTVIELVQPEDCFDGADQVGTIDGIPDQYAFADSLFDEIDGVALGYGQVGENYNFGEIRAELTGNVQISDKDGNCFDPEDPDYRPLAGVSMYLIHEDGETFHTTTDENGNYQFVGLRPGTYTVVEVNPANYIDGDITIGTASGSIDDVESITQNGSVTELTLASGEVIAVQNMESVGDPGRLDVVTEITLESDMFVDFTGLLDEPIVEDYDFCEHEPSEISGYVYHDTNLNSMFDQGSEHGIEGVEIVLLDESGEQVGESAFTDASGFYKFTGLAAGNYTVVELVQPADCFDGTDQVGTIDGEADTIAVADSLLDEIANVQLGYGQVGANYNFGEIRAALTGNVQITDEDGNCLDPSDENHRPLAGVSMYLVHEDGETLHTTTDENGDYSFSDLRPGSYTLIEVNPADYVDGSVDLGTGSGVLKDVESIIASGSVTELTLAGGDVISVSGMESVGDPARLDVVSDIHLEFDMFIDSGGRLLDPVVENYFFCESEYASLSGHVFEDLNDNGVFDDGESGIAGAQVVLLNQAGEQVAGPKFTDENGFYEFSNLEKGIYKVYEVQPDGYFDGQDHLGDILDGDSAVIALAAGTYSRFPDNPEDAVGDDNYIILRNSDGDIVDMIVVQDKDSLCEVDLGFGQHGVDYDFGEIPPSELTGNVFHDLDNDGNFDPGEQGLAGVTLELRLTFSNPFSGVALTAAHVVDPSTQLNSEGRYIVHTDDNGHYEFSAIRGGAIHLMSGGALPGNYAVYELLQPSGFLDGLDKSGSGGVADNSNHEGQPQINVFLQSLINTHSSNGARNGDLLFSIPVGIGQSAPANNFGEIRQQTVLYLPPDPVSDPVAPPAPALIILPSSPVSPPPTFIPPPADLPLPAGGGSRFTWHLSVLDGGRPRSEANLAVEESGVLFTASYLNHSDWIASPVMCGAWKLGELDAGGNGAVTTTHELVFGIHGGVPVVGDFNGDGIDEVGIFYKGEWFLDLNGDGRWDESDLWSKLGDDRDMPVTGDWDGDGKDDIGIFGPEWPGDPQALRHEPGLPDADNMSKANPKNVPPQPHQATSDGRVLRLTSRGDARADLIDHVLRYGMRQDTPVAGDWNGDGISTIGVFRNGKWHLDMDGDGQWSSADAVAHFGQAGDIPVVGDFDGNGVDEIGVFRNGRWMIDTNGNREIDAHDKVFEMGGAGDTPVVGDFDGDGIDDPGTYRDLGPDCIQGAE